MPNQQTRALKQALAAIRRGPGTRYPKELRLRAVRVAQDRMAAGSTMSGVARELGVRPPTLKSWLDSEGAPAEMVAVEVVQEAPAKVPELRVVSPQGYEVVGLSLAQVAGLLRALE